MASRRDCSREGAGPDGQTHIRRHEIVVSGGHCPWPQQNAVACRGNQISGSVGRMRLRTEPSASTLSGSSSMTPARVFCPSGASPSARCHADPSPPEGKPPVTLRGWYPYLVRRVLAHSMPSPALKPAALAKKKASLRRQTGKRPCAGAGASWLAGCQPGCGWRIYQAREPERPPGADRSGNPAARLASNSGVEADGLNRILCHPKLVPARMRIQATCPASSFHASTSSEGAGDATGLKPVIKS